MNPEVKKVLAGYGMKWVTANKIVLLFVVLALAAGCKSLPREGPLALEIEDQSVESDYLVIDVDENVVQTLSSFVSYGLSSRFSTGASKVSSDRVGAGDVIAVSIWEAGSGGLFSNGEDGNGRAEFPKLKVDNRGRISLPYVETIKVSGLTPIGIQEKIVERLQGKAIEPQALVQVVRNENNAITISGDINKPGRYELTGRGDRLIDVISKAGGTRFPARETYVTYVRGNQRGVLLLNAIMEDPAENILVRRSDQIYLTHDPKRYTVLGAVRKPGTFVFDSTKVNMLEAVAHAGGLQDARADATGLFVFRYENRNALERLGYNDPNYRPDAKTVPVIYRINMAHAKSYFYAQSFILQDKDSIFVSNAKTVQTAKFLSLVNLGLTPGIAAARIGSTF